MNDQNDWHDLIQRHLAGIASPEETTTLENALETDADLRRLYLDYANLDNALEASAEAAKALQEAQVLPLPSAGIGISNLTGCHCALLPLRQWGFYWVF